MTPNDVENVVLCPGTFLHCWWECKMIQPLWQAVWQFFRKSNTPLPYSPSIRLLGVSSNELKIYVHTKP
jgi:hypothetical protein